MSAVISLLATSRAFVFISLLSPVILSVAIVPTVILHLCFLSIQTITPRSLFSLNVDRNYRDLILQV